MDTAVYHCQHAVEKAIKGFLTRHDGECSPCLL
ncbi:MAG: HEPN domain-containing protein [Armatimonadetes bacterium]|nr:HEPN domain-containing protein [Armatimonadota bacterium]